jgi:glutamine amidotransferase
MYFVHSFRALPADPCHRIADALYGGVRIPAIVGHGNVLACQFHPEKSGEAGLGILERWVRTERFVVGLGSTEGAASS